MKGKKTTAKTPRAPRNTGAGSRGDAEAQPGPRRGKTYQPRATPWETNAPRGEWQPRRGGTYQPRATPWELNCKFMIQIGRYEELGSGVRKVNLYLPHYAPGAGKPVFEDGDMFKVTVPLAAASKTAQVRAQVDAQVTAQDRQVGEQAGVGLESGLESGPESMAARLLVSLRDACRSKSEIADALGHRSISSRLNQRVKELLAAGLVERTLPDKPTSRLQKYRLTDKGRTVMLQVKMEAGK